MEFKGITWAGNIYQKFEAMCLEVEEVMVQDTVKYVENQVQKAGISVKKFYSEVMQDLIPSSCVEVAADDMSMYPYSHTDVNKNLQPTLSEHGGEFKNKATEDKVIGDMDTWKNSPISGLEYVNLLSPLSSGFQVRNECSDVYSAKGEKLGVYKRRPVGIKRISEKNNLPKISGPMTPVSANENTLSDVRSSIDLFSLEKCDSGETVNTSTRSFEPPIDSTASNTNLSVDPVRQNEEESQSISSCHDLPSESIGTYMIGGKVPQLGSNIHSNNVESGGEEVITSDEDDIDMEFIEKVELVEPGVDIIKQVTTSKLEETCVLVEGNELHVVPQGTGKHKSYKKKICEAFSSKLRSRSRKRDEYDQCIPQAGLLGGTGSTEIVIPDLTPDFEKMKLPAQDFSESDWEFL